jgi:hypothetical protein
MLDLFQYPKLYFKRVRFLKPDTFLFYIEILIINHKIITKNYY